MIQSPKYSQWLHHETGKCSGRHLLLHINFGAQLTTAAAVQTVHGWYPDTHPPKGNDICSDNKPVPLDFPAAFAPYR